MEFHEQIEVVRRRSAGVPKILTIDLSIVGTDQKYDISGNLFYVLSAPNEYDSIDIRINETREPAISYVPGLGLQTPFYRLYITTPAGQSGDMVILFGTEAPELLRVIDHRSSIIAAATSMLAEMQGDIAPETWDTEITVGIAAAVEILSANTSRKACMIQAKAANTGIVYIGFDNTVATTKWIAELQAGMSFSIDDYRGDLWARADAAGQLVGYGEW